MHVIINEAFFDIVAWALRMNISLHAQEFLNIISQISNVNHTLVGNEMVDHSDVAGHCLSALLELHLHSRLNTWLQSNGLRELQDEMRNI